MRTDIAHAQANEFVNPSFVGLTGWDTVGVCNIQDGYIDMSWNCGLSQDVSLNAGTIYSFRTLIYSEGDGEDWETLRMQISTCNPNRTEDFSIRDGWNELKMTIRPETSQTCRFQITQLATYPAQFIAETSLTQVIPPVTLPTPTPTMPAISPYPTPSAHLTDTTSANLDTVAALGQRTTDVFAINKPSFAIMGTLMGIVILTAVGFLIKRVVKFNYGLRGL